MTAPGADPDVPRYAAASWRALGTYVQLVVDGADQLPGAQQVAVRLLAVVDRACSRFRDDSDLTLANRRPGVWTTVDPLLAAALRAALDAAEVTNGLVDPTLGRSLAAIGYDQDLADVRRKDGPAGIPLPAVRDAWRWVQVDLDGGVLVPHGVELDLGATGKAFAADLISETISAELGVGCVLSLGGDVAVGSPAAGPVPWQVAISETPDQPADTVVTLPAGGLATSTVLARRWQRGGRPVHHLLDPATGRPVDPAWRTASVTAPTCVRANTASTATVIMGAAAPGWLAEHGLSARLVGSDGSVLQVGDWLEGT